MGTEKRFDFYAKSGLLCGTDGLPHLIADPGFALKNGHASDVFIPTLGFLYFAGWLGHSGRLYLESTRSKDKEIIRRSISISYFGQSYRLASLGRWRAPKWNFSGKGHKHHRVS